MATRQAHPRRLKSIAGAVLLALGFLLLLANLDALEGQITSAASPSAQHTAGILPALILAALHGLQSYAFDHAGFMRGFLQMLVSFWPLTLIIFGAVLLQPVARVQSWRKGFGADNTAISSRGDR